MKRVLITAGPVYGKLDDNKIVSNRSRGDWALAFARYLLETGQYEVTLLVPKTMSKATIWEATEIRKGEPTFGLTIIQHDGFDEYAAQCLKLAKTHDAAVMAAAVVNWIPTEPVKGKMATEGYKPGDQINIPFYLAPRVIDEMRKVNPKLTLIGCKLLSGASKEILVDAAYHVILHAKCHAVIANDLSHLRDKYLVMPDLSVHDFNNNFTGLYNTLQSIIEDVHYMTNIIPGPREPVCELRDLPERLATARRRFDSIVERYREGFIPGGNGKVFGSLAVQVAGMWWLVSPREKGAQFTSADAVLVLDGVWNDHKIREEPPWILTYGGKATLNAPLLIQTGNLFKATAVLHQHHMLEDVPTVPYAPPGTVRDNDRDIPAPTFNIAGHGFVACLNEKDCIR